MNRTFGPPAAVGGLCSALLLGAALGRPDAGVDVPGAFQEFVAFTADGPVRVRVAVAAGGGSAAGPWAAAADALFRFADWDGDGLLAADERQPFLNPPRSGQFVVVNGMLVQPPRMPALNVAADAKVDAAAFRAALAVAGVGPVDPSPVAVRADSAALTDALFKALDADGDGKLSAAELQAAPARLARLDTNEDELLSADELLGKFQNPFQAFAVRVDFNNGLQPAPPPLPDVVVPPAGQRVTARALLAARDADKDGGLSAKELGCDPAALADLDADGDGRLDADELAAWLRRPLDLDVTVDLPAEPGPARPWWAPDLRAKPAAGPRAGSVAVAKTSRLADRVKPDRDGRPAADLRDLRVRFAADDQAGPAARRQWEATAGGFRRAFDQIAKDTGVAERAKLADNPETAGLVGLFDFADRDKDGTVTTAEVDRLARVGEALVNCRAVVEVADLGRGLFELLDRDGDGSLSPREQAVAVGVLAGRDRDGDGKLSRGEIARGLAVTVKPASVDVLPSNQVYEFVAFSTVDRVVRSATPGDVPEWFRQADRNGDGDVSRKEFPGPPALFAKLDRDGDGLISPDEARAAAVGKKD